jgi:hypothetical protein
MIGTEYMDNTMLETCNGAMCLADLKAEEGQNLREENAHPDNACIRWEAERLVSTQHDVAFDAYANYGKSLPHPQL